ncbi:MAG TPA: DNA polymerase Y family protein [Azospira sp.]|nr:DNA polymerase Y family protein [Azospira sp.]HNN09088.1 DNA polymerase Y family protein [Azospira sp.]HNN45795.1 DNA polymerase Y family protein [Azospira sp.]
MLWLALRLPLLSLEVFPQQPSPSATIARERIVACDPLAASGGVMPGMRLADAWSLLPELAVQERDAERERRRLETLACWAGGFTSEVSLALPDALLLEVAGSLRLFGGLEALLARLLQGIAGQGHAACTALAPTPRAALWLAVAGEAGNAAVPRCLDVADLRDTLGTLPLEVLELDAAQMRRITGFGARNLGDLLRLPRSGLARRLGIGLTTSLAQALGEVPDLRERFRFPDTFRESLELPARVEDAARLLFAAQRLVQVLCGWLAARGSGIAACRLQLEHERGHATLLELVFAAPTRDPERIGRVLRERLERLSLIAPVAALVLLAGAPEPLPGREGGLFGETAAGEGVMLLVERLQARLGEASVHAVAARPEHRPERASTSVAPGLGSAAVFPGPRPCWLLPRPQPLSEVGGRPQRDGPLTLLAGPERIESGWWDAGEAEAVGDVRRDYFVALSSRHEWLWVYRCHEGWFLHGHFS